MKAHTRVASSKLLSTLKQQRTALASALTVAILVIGFFHAPAGPVLAGCGLAMAAIFGRNWIRQ
jgi:hypothetical protein